MSALSERTDQLAGQRPFVCGAPLPVPRGARINLSGGLATNAQAAKWAYLAAPLASVSIELAGASEANFSKRASGQLKMSLAGHYI